MALRSRQHMENLNNVKPLGANAKLLGQQQGLKPRAALENIQNRRVVSNQPAKKVVEPLKAKVTTRSSATLNKENVGMTRSTTATTKQKSGNAKPVTSAPEPITECEINNLSDSCMDISIAEDEGFSSSILPKGVSNIDIEDGDNPFLCSDIVMDIYKYLRKVEMQWTIRPGFLTHQSEVTPRMRTILVDWLNQVHTRFGLLPETLYLTIATVDRFLQDHQVSRKHLQLVGVTAMFIASKYEEMYSPPVSDFVYITDSAYKKNDIFKMECLMLKTLQFSFTRPLPLHFLRRNSKAGKCDAIIHTMSKFLMELSLQDYELATVTPSLLAAAALCLSLKVVDDAPWTANLEFYSGYTEMQMKPVMSQLARLVLKNETSKHRAVYKKYASSKLLKISTLPHLKSTAMQGIAQLTDADMK